MIDKTSIDHLANAIAVFTPNGLYSPHEIYPTYGLDEDGFEALQFDPYYQERLKFHSDAIGTDRNSLLRAQAKLMTDSNLRSLYDIANDPKGKPSDRLKASALIADIADVKPKAEQQFSGMVLNIDFGLGVPVSVSPAVQPDIIEHKPDPTPVRPHSDDGSLFGDAS